MLAWYDRARRDLPWRTSPSGLQPDFYHVWLSEIMLQQTRVETVIPYYHRFLARFPSVDVLAAAPESDVLALWSGLGYYSRARSLHRAAKQIAAQGIPAGYEEVRLLPGVGEYTAAAVASIALGLPRAAVDGNVMRVLSRLANDASEITSAAVQRRFRDRAAGLLDVHRPGDFNQAMMELGATVCLPRTPGCASCPVARFCAARAAGTERELPVKLRKAKTRDVMLALAVLERNNSVFLIQRDSTERRMADFWELPGRTLLPGLARKLRKAGEFRHQIVNDRFRVTVWHAAVTALRPCKALAGRWFAVAALGRIPLTTVTRKALARTGLPPQT